MAKYTVCGEQFDSQGMYVDNDRETLFGSVPTEHEQLSKAKSACLGLRTTGDWPDGRPNYWIEDEAGTEVEIDWAEIEETYALAKDLFSMR